MKEFSLRWIDLAAALAWIVCGTLALEVSVMDADRLRPWVAITAVLAALSTVIAWLSRRMDRLESHVYTEGFRAGFDGRQVVKLPEQRR